MFETATYEDPLVLDPEIRARWAFLETSSAAAVLRSVCPAEWADIVFILGSFRLDPSRWLVAGGNRGILQNRSTVCLVHEAGGRSE